ncbi:MULTISPECIES: serine/threonine protein kinase [unclassified Corallococcus]|uniref:serine/threonine protein kinase n=1 Tax=unclassified Corallococcus TaxID=2685029 RepID=UPI001A8D3EB6|nr:MULTISPECIES: serine/threonine protein kinase [unclassified Corallococcus]MBN9684147.1 protein kinase [Corallococcus sp. NCSPR001]WAS84364.1 protein kinase [Corallococcus sp. NCRR]
MSATLLNLPPGSLIDGWQVAKPLGAGGFARVYLGEKNGRHRAIKVAQHREASGDLKQTHARTLRELTALLMLDHSNIVRPQGYGLAESGNLYLALDYVDGWTLAEWSERKHPTVREVLGVFEKLAGALAYMHGRGILHRDLKLSNVLIRKSDGEPVIIDFSCATYAHAEDLTDGGLPPGTDRYRAPEQFRFLREHKNEHRAHYAFQVADEVFAIGVMLHELLTDPRPTEFRPRFDFGIAAMPPHSPRLANARIPEAVSDLIESMLNLDPKRRPVDTEALRRELAELRADPSSEYDVPGHPPSEQRHGVPTPAALAMPSTPQTLKRHVARVERPRGLGRWVAALTGIVALVAISLLWRLSGDLPGTPVESRGTTDSRPLATLRSTPPKTVPPAMSTSGPSPVTAPGPAIADAPKEGSTVKTPHPETPTPGRTSRMPKKAVAAAECASLSLVAALAAGCPGAQIRPETFTCPDRAFEAMTEQLHWKQYDNFTVQMDDRQPAEVVWFSAGAEVVGVVPKGINDDRQEAVAPVGTRFYGKAYYLSSKMGRSDGPALVVRYDRVKLPGQGEYPICFVVEAKAAAFKDGKVKAYNRAGGFVVYRWP